MRKIKVQELNKRNVKRVLIINPPNEPFTEKSLLIEPIDVLNIATIVEKLGSEVKFVDMDVKRKKAEEIEETIKQFNPEITIIPFDYHIPLHTTEAITNINKIGKIAKKNKSKVIITGKTSTYHPDQFLGKGATIVVNGEIEQTIEELIKLKIWNKNNLEKIKGITFLYKGEIKRTTNRNERINLDNLPITNRILANISEYIDVRTILNSRGCFGRCHFCPTTKYW